MNFLRNCLVISKLSYQAPKIHIPYLRSVNISIILRLLTSESDHYSLMILPINFHKFQELNGIAIDQYSNLSHSAGQIKDSLRDLDVKYKLLLPYLEQLNQLGQFKHVFVKRGIFMNDQSENRILNSCRFVTWG